MRRVSGSSCNVLFGALVFVLVFSSTWDLHNCEVGAVPWDTPWDSSWAINLNRLVRDKLAKARHPTMTAQR